MHRQTSNIRIEFCKHATPQLAPDIQQLLGATPWKPNWSEELANRIVKWRYCELHESEIALAYDGYRPVAMIASYTRPYIVGQKVIRLREASDWFCLPEYRHLGLGVRLMYILMDEQEPLIVIGGNANAQAVLPALGWRRLPDVRDYTMPLSTKCLTERLYRWLRLPITRTGRVRSSTSRPGLGHTVRQRHSARQSQRAGLSDDLPVMTPADVIYELMPLVREREVQWLRAAPEEMGTFFCLIFQGKMRPEGFSIGRIYSDGNLKNMKLIHIETSKPCVEVYAGMLAEIILYGREQGVDVAQFRASCPLLRRALREFGFVWSGPTPAYWWAKNGFSPGNRLHLTYLRGDDGLRPYPA